MRVARPLPLRLLLLVFFFAMLLGLFTIYDPFEPSGGDGEVGRQKWREWLLPPFQPNTSLQQLVNTLLKEEYQHGESLLSDMESLRRANSDILPRESYFTGSNKLARPATTVTYGDELCSDDGKEDGREKSCVGKFIVGRLTRFYAMAPKYKTIGCLLRKNMSTLMRAIFCYLRDEENIRSSGASLFYLGYVKHRPDIKMCKTGGTHARGVILDTVMQKNSSWNFLAVVREPVDRFLSAFLDKCIRHPRRDSVSAATEEDEEEQHQPPADRQRIIPCNGCGSNLTCFIITEFHKMKEFESSEILAGRLSNSSSTRHRHRITLEDRHVFPQNWQCDFKNHLSRYALVRYSSPASSGSHGKTTPAAGENAATWATRRLSGGLDFPARLVDSLAKVGVGAESLAFIRHHLVADTTHHVTHDTEARRFLEQRLRGSPFLMEFLVRMFYWDFRLLGFPLPRLSWGK